jgi:hypothetical protein
MRILIVEIPEPVSQPGLPVGEAHPVGRLWVKGQPEAVQGHHQQQASPHHTPPVHELGSQTQGCGTGTGTVGTVTF